MIGGGRTAYGISQDKGQLLYPGPVVEIRKPQRHSQNPLNPQHCISCYEPSLLDNHIIRGENRHILISLMGCQKPCAVFPVIHIVLVGNGHQFALCHGIGKIPVILYIALPLLHIYLQTVFPGHPVNVGAGSGGADDNMSRHGLGLKGTDALLQIRRVLIGAYGKYVLILHKNVPPASDTGHGKWGGAAPVF